MKCQCDASWSGRDEAEYCARGCPSCTCGMIDYKAKTPLLSFDVVNPIGKALAEEKQQQSMDEHMVKTSSAKRL
jgi:hypothetical protein